ncbi:MAG: lipocalin family protein [Muribaculaceae bacterium]|nr:lipocalin family protein [Muribaculaceae bacterium]
MEKIKNNLLILLVSFGMAAAFTACSDDDKDDNGYSALIVGTWIDVDYPEDGYTFRSNGSFTIFIEGDEENGRWSISGDRLIMDVDGEKEVQTILTLTKDELRLEDEDGDIYRYVKR